MTSNQLTVPDGSPPCVVVTTPPGNNPDNTIPDNNLLMLATLNHHNQNQSNSTGSARRNTNDSLDRGSNQNSSRRPSWFLPKGLSKRPSVMINKVPLLSYLNGNQSRYGSKFSLNGVPVINPAAVDAKLKNRRLGYDALSAALSALYAKLIIVLGLALPVTNILSYKGSASFYQGFYLYLYTVSVLFVAFVYLTYLRSRSLMKILSIYPDREASPKKLATEEVRYGSFYLRVGIVAFGIGSMVYCGLEFGQYFELKGDPECQNILIAITPATRMILTIAQIQFFFLNHKEIFMAKHQIISRFGLMHMIATNLCEWLYVIIEETKHEIIHFTEKHEIVETATEALKFISDADMAALSSNHSIVRRATGSTVLTQCRRTNIMGSLVQNASQFLFPCTIEYSLICAVILFEMWKKIKSIDKIERSRRNSKRPPAEPKKDGTQLSVDCSGVNRGMFAGVLVIVLTIISLIMYFVLIDKKSYEPIAILEITITEIIMYCMTIVALAAAMIKMRDLKYIRKEHSEEGLNLDCTLLAVAQSGIYIYNTFSIIGHLFSLNEVGASEGLWSEIIGIVQTSLQTLFIFNSWWRRCKGAQQNREKPGRQIITFLLVVNMAMWFISTLAKNAASFRPTHMRFFGMWAWTIITHLSMPLAIFYRFHSTICLFEIWKSVYKMKHHH